MIYYAGIGARRTPSEVLKTMTLYGSVFAEMGFTLRSGAADGADSAFERGCDIRHGKKEIFIPWKGFNGSSSEYYHIDDKVFPLAENLYGSRWKYLSQGAKKLMARNICQILGPNLDSPSHFVVCWTPDGIRSATERSSKSGGTGQAIACASQYDIPVFNLKNDGEIDRLIDFSGEM